MVEGDRDGDELASASTDDPAAPNSSSDHRPSGNVSGSAVHNRDPPNGIFFQKARRRFFAIGLSVEGMRSKRAASIALAVIKLVIMPLAVYGLCLALGLNPLYTIVAVVCAAVPTAKTVFILAGEYRVEEELVTATVSITTLLSVVTLLGWLYALSVLSPQAA
jgi:hypothetical protein